jgi:integrase
MARKPRKRPSGQGTIWERGGNFWIQWRENGRRRSAKHSSRETAKEVLAKIVADVERVGAGLPVKKPLAPLLSVLAKDWLARREKTHRAWRDDKNRWNKHLGPFLGSRRPDEIDAALIRRMVEAKLSASLSSTSVGHLVRLLSTFFSDLVEQGHATANPVASLPKATRRLFRNAHDPKQTPFLEKQDDIRRVFLALEQPFATFFAIGALAGLRPGEILALEWGDIDLGSRRILVQRQVRHGKVGPTKSGKPRLVPVIEPLAKILAEWKLGTGGEGRVFRPIPRARRTPRPSRPRTNASSRPAAKPRFLGPRLIQLKLRAALKECGLPETLTLYECGRHTFGAQHVLGGGSLATLREILGHSTVKVTERYGHLRADLFRPGDLLTLSVDLTRPTGAVIDLASHRDDRDRGPASNAVATRPEGRRRKQRTSTENSS